MSLTSSFVSQQAQLFHWLQHDDERMYALHAGLNIAKQNRIEHWLIAAGFVRNLVWDKLHGYPSSLSGSGVKADIDFIYFCPKDSSKVRDLDIEQQFQQLGDEFTWSVKNQHRMHSRNGDKPYVDLVDSMGHWPEKETAIGVRLEPNLISYEFHLESAFGLESLFGLQLSHNPKRQYQVFQSRLTEKSWLERYPKLTIMPIQVGE
ncbi:nucleotidyltransferase family protein [Shewanella sp. SR44-3]|uniref:nucleotidyltransferase family protein n=1 Tax=unclassified Shewanella TaxID=196818 RepID=UPI0015FADC54|nr:nucleotidyltransferase family protein [Shewanella sp. SR44-3]MBB1270647.1 nucleotidyltransferase family protein [Shewanella sp. SR44-3]